MARLNPNSRTDVLVIFGRTMEDTLSEQSGRTPCTGTPCSSWARKCAGSHWLTVHMDHSPSALEARDHEQEAGCASLLRGRPAGNCPGPRNLGRDGLHAVSQRCSWGRGAVSEWTVLISS